jgi:hypothetical protein
VELITVISPSIGGWPLPDAAMGGFPWRYDLRRGIHAATSFDPYRIQDEAPEPVLEPSLLASACVCGPPLRRPHAIVESTRPTATFPIRDHHTMANIARINSMIRLKAPSTRLSPRYGRLPLSLGWNGARGKEEKESGHFKSARTSMGRTEDARGELVRARKKEFMYQDVRQEDREARAPVAASMLGER